MECWQGATATLLKKSKNNKWFPFSTQNTNFFEQEDYSLRHTTIFCPAPACPEITDLAYVWFKQVCHKEDNTAEALLEMTRDSWLDSGTERGQRAATEIKCHKALWSALLS